MYNAHSFLTSGRSFDLAAHVGRRIAKAKPGTTEYETAARIYRNLTPESKGRADFAATLEALG